MHIFNFIYYLRLSAAGDVQFRINSEEPANLVVSSMIVSIYLHYYVLFVGMKNLGVAPVSHY